jgi:hypothetical protein
MNRFSQVRALTIGTTEAELVPRAIQRVALTISPPFSNTITVFPGPDAVASPDYSRDFVAKARFPKRIADAPGAAQRGALAVRRSEQRGRKTRGARKTSLQQKES